MLSDLESDILIFYECVCVCVCVCVWRGRLFENNFQDKISKLCCQFCHSSRLTGSFSCKTVLIIEQFTCMSKTHFGKISEICFLVVNE